MRLFIFDPGNLDYDTQTAQSQPMGGTETAIVQLSRALVRLGHQLCILNGVAEPRHCDGVDFQPLPVDAGFLNSFDLGIVVSYPFGATLRQIGCQRPLVLWCHIATDQPAVASLKQAEQRTPFAGLAMVSLWQAARYHQDLGVPIDQMRVMRNAVSACFLQETERAPLWLQRGKPPILAYSSHPARGLDVLLLAFPMIRRRFPGARLKIFSFVGARALSGKNQDGDQFRALEETALTLPGVEYVGALPHPRLAEEIARTDIFAYPCHYPETSCIAAMEAMAAGTLLITSNFGALPETTEGFGHIVDFTLSFNLTSAFATAYARGLIRIVEGLSEDPAALAAKIARQVEHCRRYLTWEMRALEWTEWLQELLARSR